MLAREGTVIVEFFLHLEGGARTARRRARAHEQQPQRVAAARVVSLVRDHRRAFGA
jgi:hypothetical protein